MATAVATLQNNIALNGPIGSLESYFQTVGNIPVLNKEDEKKLSLKFQSEGDLDAARSLVMAHLRFVVHIAKGYTGYGLPLADLIQEGNVGLMKAVKKFDTSFDVRLVSFAVHWIRAEIHEYVLKNWRIVKVATTKAQRKLFFNLRKNKKNLSWLSFDETQAVAKDLGVSTKDVTNMERRLTAHDASFDPVQISSDEDQVFSPSAYLQSANADPADIIESEDWSNNSKTLMLEALKTLDERSRYIVQSRWLGENKMTLHELAKKYSVSAERVRQIESSAIKKLRTAMCS